MQHSRTSWGRVAIVLVALSTRAEAQTVTVPTFVVRSPSAPVLVAEPSVAASVDGTMLFTWRELAPGDPTSLRVYSQRFSNAGVPLAPPVLVDGGLALLGPEASATSTGDWVVSFRNFDSQPSYFLNAYGRRLDTSGGPLGLLTRIDESNGISAFVNVAALANGTVFQWGELPGLRARLYDLAGVPRGATFAVDDNLSGVESDVAALPDGGFVSVWNRGGGGYDAKLRVFDADGQPRGAAMFAGNTFLVKQVAADPSGGLALVGASTKVAAARFDATGHQRGGAFDVSDYETNWRPDPDIDVDSQGNLYVLWTKLNVQTSALGPLLARAFDRNNIPLGPAVVVRPAPIAAPARTARLSNDTFVNVWIENGEISADIVSLCAAGASTCGDGVAHPQCEQCDAGVANSDTTPNACRTSCRLAACGDHVIDAGEECDDGNRLTHDGCDQNCLVESCGNGRRESSETCDDGNAVEGDGCDSNCTATGCGNAILTAGEECDDGNVFNQDGCDQNCLTEVCGNLRVEAGEGCDDANLVEGDGCDSNCTVSVCGNGIVAPDEQCDDTNFVNGDGCDAHCLVEICGDGFIEGNEGCDDGNLIDDDGCQADCEPTPQIDVLLEPLRPLRVVLPSSGTVQKRVRLRVAHAGVAQTQSVRLVADDGTCPPGTVSVPPDFDRALAGVQDVVTLQPHERATALMVLAFDRASLMVLDRRAPRRCSVSLTAAASAGNFDVNGSNNSWSLSVDVTDPHAASNDVPEVLLRPLKPQAVVIPAGALGADRRLPIRLQGTAAAGASLVADDGDCPPGTLSVTAQPGGTGIGEIDVRASRSFFATTAVSPARCRAALSVMPVSDTEPTNNVVPITLDVSDHNDF